MGGKRGMVLGLLLLVPGLAEAGPFFGDLGSFCFGGKDCPPGEYCPLHYWTPGLYRIRANVHPSNLDQFSPGPYPSGGSAILTKPNIPAGQQIPRFHHSLRQSGGVFLGDRFCRKSSDDKVKNHRVTVSPFHLVILIMP